MSAMNRQILHGDVLKKLVEISDETFDTIISSPPYWGLRDYGTGSWVGGKPDCKHDSIRHKTRAERGGLSDVQKGNEGSFGDESKWKSKTCPDCGAQYNDEQLGLEPDFRDYLKIMSKIMTELKRVLKKTGTCWINLGDCYGSHRSNEESLHIGFDKQEREPIKGYDKSRMGIPERFYIQCIDDGWIARNHIPWYKANSMPSSVKDRFTNKWESIFFFAKQQKYYFNLDAVREKTITESKPFNVRVRDSKKGLTQQKLTGGMSDEEDQNYNGKGELKQDNTKGADGKPILTYSGFNDRWKHSHVQNNSNPQTVNCKSRSETPNSHQNGKNPGDVFFINPRPFAEAHFATFPVDLPIKILKCACPHDGIVLDPFFGAGTVGVAAEMLGLQWCGIELNKQYITIARNRLEQYLNNKLEIFT